MEKFLNKLIHSELLHVELIALGFILLLFILGLIFSYNIRKILYPSIIILIFFPLIWFGIKWLVGSIRQISLPSISIWVWIILGAIIALFLIWKFWPRLFSKSGRLVAIDSKTGGLVVVKKSKGFWSVLWPIIFVAVGAFIVWMSIFLSSHPWKYLRLENQTADIEGSSEKKVGAEMIKPEKNKNYDFDGKEYKTYMIDDYGPEQYEIPAGRNAKDTITLYFTGPSGQWSRSVWYRNGTLYYHVEKIRTDFLKGIHTIRASKPCTMLITNAKTRIEEVL